MKHIFKMTALEIKTNKEKCRPNRDLLEVVCLFSSFEVLYSKQIGYGFDLLCWRLFLFNSNSKYTYYAYIVLCCSLESSVTCFVHFDVIVQTLEGVMPF